MRISDWSSDVCSSNMTTLASYDIARRITSRFRKLTSGYTSGSFSNDLGTAFVNFTASDGRLYRAYVAMAADTFARPIGFDHITGKRPPHDQLPHTGRASCRERGCEYV